MICHRRKRRGKPRRVDIRLCVASFAWLAVAGAAHGQSSSLYIQEPQPFERIRQPGYTVPDYQPRRAVNNRLSPAIAATSLVAVPVPEPRLFAVEDLVTIIIREDTQSDWESSLETSKEATFEGELTEFPDFLKLAQFTLAPADFQDIKLALEHSADFEGDGDMSRRETITARIQARVIDVKPNGNLILEARKFNQVDNETLTLILTGTCRPEDISVDNTILSTQLYDLHLVKTTTGDLRRAAKKGVITRVLDFLFNF